MKSRVKVFIKLNNSKNFSQITKVSVALINYFSRLHDCSTFQNTNSTPIIYQIVNVCYLRNTSNKKDNNSWID